MLLALRLAVLLAAAVLMVGCAGEDEADTERTTPAATTSEEVKLAVFERSYSECSSESLQQLSAKYERPPRPLPIALAVARAWTERFGGGPDAVPSGRDGCLQALRER